MYCRKRERAVPCNIRREGGPSLVLVYRERGGGRGQRAVGADKGIPLAVEVRDERHEAWAQQWEPPIDYTAGSAVSQRGQSDRSLWGVSQSLPRDTHSGGLECPPPNITESQSETPVLEYTLSAPFPNTKVYLRVPARSGRVHAVPPV